MYGISGLGLDMGFDLDPKWLFPELTDGQKSHWKKKIRQQYLLALAPILFVLASCILVFQIHDPNYAIVAAAVFAGTLFLIGYVRQKTLGLRKRVQRDLAVKQVLAEDRDIDTLFCNLARLMVAVSGYPKTADGKKKLEEHFRKCHECSKDGAFQHDLLSDVVLTGQIKEELERYFGPCEFKQ